MGRVSVVCRFRLHMCPGWMEQGEPSAEAQDSRDGKGPAQESMWPNWDQAHVLPSRPPGPPPSTPFQPVLNSPACSF